MESAAFSNETSTYVNLSFRDFLAGKVRDEKDRVALVYNGESYTWNDIDICSQIMACDLEKLGVTSGSHVALSGLNSANWVIAFYAIHKLGAMALLVNPSLRAGEIARVAMISDASYLIYGEMPEMKDEETFIRDIRNAEGCRIRECYSVRNLVYYKDRMTEYENLKDRFGDSKDGDHPCVMIFTSGSTGIPKGVILSAYNILNAAILNAADQTLNESDKTCLILPLFHIFGLVAGLFANAVSRAVIYIPKDIRTDTLLKLMSEERCTIFHSVPTMLIALMNNKDFDPERFSSLRCTIVSGAAATQAQIRMFKEKLPGDHFLASYGLSEMAPVSITEYDDTEAHVLYTVGRPVKNIKIKIRDLQTGKDCPAGTAGEILVRGFNLMVGYYKVPIEDQSIDGDGWLHTGDLGQIDEDGYLRLSGRLKELIIRGGENIVPGEVEAAISKLPIIDNVKVIGIPSDFFGEEVCACIKLKSGAEFDEESVKATLHEKLAKFKIPSRFIVYDEFPMLGTGKIDVVALKKDVMSEENVKP